tara:strand:+ start:1053 stop:3113 length:2061 start_codon:yes stop_codon:yes gene_type:complete
LGGAVGAAPAIDSSNYRPKYVEDNIVRLIDGSIATIIRPLAYNPGNQAYQVSYNEDGSQRVIKEVNIKEKISDGDDMMRNVREHERIMDAFRKEHPNVKPKSKPKTFEEAQAEAHAKAAKEHAKELQRKKDRRREAAAALGRRRPQAPLAPGSRVIYKNQKNGDEEPLQEAKIIKINTDPISGEYDYQIKIKSNEKDINTVKKRIEPAPDMPYDIKKYIFKFFYDELKDGNHICKEGVEILVGIDEIMYDYLGYDASNDYEFSYENLCFLSFICKTPYKDGEPAQLQAMPSGSAFPVGMRSRNIILRSFYSEFVNECKESYFLNNKIAKTKGIFDSNLEKIRNKEIPQSSWSKASPPSKEEQDLEKANERPVDAKEAERAALEKAVENSLKDSKEEQDIAKAIENSLDDVPPLLDIRTSPPPAERMSDSTGNWIKQGDKWVNSSSKELKTTPRDINAFPKPKGILKKVSNFIAPAPAPETDAKPKKVSWKGEFCPEECLKKIRKVEFSVNHINEFLKKEINRNEDAFNNHIQWVKDTQMPWLTASGKAIGENSKAIRSLVENDKINDIRHDNNKKEHKLLFDKIEELQKEMRKDINRIDGAVRAITSAMSVDDARAEARRAAEARAETRRAFGRRAAADLGYNYEYDDNLDEDDIEELEDLERRFGRKPSSSEEATEWVNKFGDGR